MSDSLMMCGCSDRYAISPRFKCIVCGPVCVYCAADCVQKHWRKLRSLSGHPYKTEILALRAVARGK